MRIPNHHHRALYKATLGYLEQNGNNPLLARALHTALERARWVTWLYKQARKARARFLPRQRYTRE